MVTSEFIEQQRQALAAFSWDHAEEPKAKREELIAKIYTLAIILLAMIVGVFFGEFCLPVRAAAKGIVQLAEL